MGKHTRTGALTFATVVGLVTIACGPSLPLRVAIPREYQHQPPDLVPPPNGEVESVRYEKAYTAFWWNCTIVKSRDLAGQCPFLCNGTPAAVAGCGAGATDAENRIAKLERRYGGERTQEYLVSHVRDSDGYSNIRSYFPDGPVADKNR
jgi:hypothetical protein